MARDLILLIGSRLFMDIGFAGSKPEILRPTMGKSLRRLRSYVSYLFFSIKLSILRYLRLTKYLSASKSEFVGVEINKEVTFLGSTTIESFSLDMTALAGVTCP